MAGRRSVISSADLDHPELRPYGTMRRPAEHRARGIFVAEGALVVRRLLESTLDVESLFLSPRQEDALAALLAEPRHARVPVYIADEALLSTFVGYHLHQGALAVARVPRERDPVDVLRSRAAPRLAVALDGLAHAENVGVIARNAAAFGADVLIAGETTASPYLRRAVRNSMGAIFRLPVFHAAALPETLARVRAEGLRIAAADPLAPVALAAADLAGDLCLVLGHEGHGLSPAVAALADLRVAIPMANAVDSLNVGCASAVFLHEVARRRGIRTAGDDRCMTQPSQAEPH